MKAFSASASFLALLATSQAASTIDSSSVAAAAYWSFQEEASPTAYQISINRQKGFLGTPSVTFSGSGLQGSGHNSGFAFSYDDVTFVGGIDSRAAGWQHGRVGKR